MAQNVVQERIVDEIGDSRTAILKAFKKGVHIIEVSTSAKKQGSFAKLMGIEGILERTISSYLDKLFNMSHPNESIR